MLWQHAVNGGNKVIEYLLCLRMKRDKDSGFAVEIKSIQETELKKNVLEKHDELVSRTNKRILSRRARIEGELKIIEFEFGQASLTFAGTLEAQGGKQIAKFITTQTSKRNSGIMSKMAFNVLRQRSRASNSSGISSLSSTGGGGMWGGASDMEVNAIFTSLKSLLSEVIGEHFHKPDVIDRRRREHFTQSTMLSAPPLTEAEDTILALSEAFEGLLPKNAKRIKGSLAEGLDKYKWQEKNKLWGAFEVTLDTSAESLLFQLFEMDKYEDARSHHFKYGDLPRKVVKNVDGTRSTHHRVAISFPPPYRNRVFDSSYVWKQVERSNGKRGYVMAFEPLNDFKARLLDDSQADMSIYNCKKGSTKGAYIITSLAPNVCRWTRIQCIDFNATAKSDSMENFLVNKHLSWANEMQEKFKRNSKEVDAEVQAAHVEVMKEGVTLNASQKEVFRDLEDFFRGEGKANGWNHLNSPYSKVKMEIKHFGRDGEKTTGQGRAQTVADCSPEQGETICCSRERKKALSKSHLISTTS
jgi:hypothetical protein